ncbi:hypothetical protein B178_01276 [Corynebacterium diphtheriae DSM 43988]|nr:hypothetical protein B178_01276 [Corynebacterium diphtheriae DSM 43988]
MVGGQHAVGADMVLLTDLWRQLSAAARTSEHAFSTGEVTSAQTYWSTVYSSDCRLGFGEQGTDVFSVEQTIHSCP